MPVTPTYPGVYIQEVPSGVRTITGVATSITAFIGRALRGPVNQPVRIQSFADFERQFGGLWTESTLSYAVQHFFLHGGTDALIVRVFSGELADNTATIALPTDALTLEAASPGKWGNNLRVRVDHDTRDPAPGEELPGEERTQFNLTIEETDFPTPADPAAEPQPQVVATEIIRNVSSKAGAVRAVASVLARESQLARVRGSVNATPDVTDPTSLPLLADGSGGDGGEISFAEVTGSEADREGLYALDGADLFNLLCIPPPTRDSDWGTDQVWNTAAVYCQQRRAMLIIDPPAAWDATPNAAVSNAETGVSALRGFVGVNAINAAAYFPRLRVADPLDENRPGNFAPSGAVAGIYSRTDATRGVWKAPAGLEASFSGVREFTYRLTDGENGRLNPLGLNCFRSFPVNGNVVWGARTLAGADQLASEWKYVPVRRTALFIEESLYRGTQFAVFEPNDEPLWSQLRLSVGAFMQNLFRQGAFQGRSAREAYFVKCDAETTTQNDINLGIVNVLVGFAPLRPAEFVIIRIQQLAGQVEV